jgi:hypothetical protein
MLRPWEELLVVFAAPDWFGVSSTPARLEGAQWVSARLLEAQPRAQGSAGETALPFASEEDSQGKERAV